MKSWAAYLVFGFVSFLSVSCSMKSSKSLDYVRVSESSTKILIGSCNDTSMDQGFWKTLSSMRADLMIMMGDNVYGAGNNQESLRKAYAALKNNSDFQSFRENTPILATWDDHDYGANDAGAEFSQKEDSKEQFMDFWEEPKNSERRIREGVYDSFVVGPPGASLQVILLDTRSFRTPLKTVRERMPGRGPYGPPDDPNQTILGDEQWAWFKTQLETPADIRLVVSSIQFIGDGRGFESWANFPKEKRKLLSMLDKSSEKRVILLSGDRHHASFWEFKRPGKKPLHEFTSSPLNRVLPTNLQIERPEKYRVSPLEFRANFGVLNIDWINKQIVLEIRLSDGSLVRQKAISFKN